MTSIGHFRAAGKVLEAKSAGVYRYMNFDKIAEFKELADTVTV